MKKNSRSVFIMPGVFYSGVTEIFGQNGYLRTQDIDEADAIVFIGGTDISSSLYGQKAVGEAQRPDVDRDELEVNVYRTFVGIKPMIGICRGAQLLNVLNGGTLWQHVNNHGMIHWAVDLTKPKEKLRVSSMHHQMMRPAVGAETFLVANEATMFKDYERTLYDTEKTTTPYMDAEGVFYPKTKSLCFQSHPEVGPKEHTKYFFDQIHERLEI